MILIGGASETYRGGMGAFQEERQVLIASPFCKFAHGIESVAAHPLLCRDGDPATRSTAAPAPPISTCPTTSSGAPASSTRSPRPSACPKPPRMVAPAENVEAALNLLEKAQRPLVILGKGMAWSRGEDEVRAFIERTQVPFVRSPMGKGVMPDDHPLSAGAARTLALQQADVIFLMGARLNWIFHFGLPPRYAKDVKVIQLDIAPEEIGHNKPTEVALVGDGKAIMAQLNKALANRQWFHPKDTPWRQALAEEGGRKCRDDQAADRRRPGAGRLLPGAARRRRLDAEERDPQRRGRRHHGYRPHAVAELRTPVPCLNAGTYGTMGVGLGQAIAAAVADPSRPVIHLSGDSAIGFSGMEMETLVRYNLPVKIVVLNNGGIGPGMPEIPENPMFNLKPNALIYGARYDKVMEAFGGKGLFVKEPKDIRKALDEAMAFPRPRPGQRRALAGLDPQGAAVRLA